MTLIHVLAIVAPTGVFAMGLAFALEHYGLSSGLPFLAPLLLVPAVESAWWILRAFGYPPMGLGTGPCPTCERHPTGWHFRWESRNSMVFRCDDCGSEVLLWLGRTRAPAQDSPRPMFQLRWPELVGAWRRAA